MLTSLAGHEGRSQDLNGCTADDKEAPLAEDNKTPQHWMIKKPKHQDDPRKDCHQENNQM
jgi:hypothetical protein